jgi:hypothetical protein
VFSPKEGIQKAFFKGLKRFRRVSHGLEASKRGAETKAKRSRTNPSFAAFWAEKPTIFVNNRFFVDKYVDKYVDNFFRKKLSTRYPHGYPHSYPHFFSKQSL